MKGLIAVLLLVAVPVSVTFAGDFGATVEQVSVGIMFSVLSGFIAGQIVWVAAPQFDEEEDPYRVELPAALAVGYGIGVPFGAALGVHLASLTTSKESTFWARWVGAEIATLVGSGTSLLLVSLKSDTTAIADTPLEVAAAGIPIVFGVGGALAGDALARKLGWADSSSPDVWISLKPKPEGSEISLGIRIPF